MRKVIGNRGDTLVEILLAISIVSMILAGAFTSVTHSLREATLSQERSEALGVAGAQLENVRALSKEPNTDVFNTANPLFCVSGGEIKRFTHNTPPDLESDNFTSYPTECQNLDIRYNVSVHYNSAQSLFTSRARWDGPTGSRQEVVLSYRVHLNVGATTPAPPPPPGPACPLASTVTINFPGYPGTPTPPTGIYDDQNPFRLSHNPASLPYMPGGYPNVTPQIPLPAIPAYNNYIVEFGLYDQHHAAATPQQDDYEQMKIVLYNGSGNPVYTSPNSPDLPESQLGLTVEFVGQNIPANPASVRAHHTWDNWPAATPDPSFPHRGNSFNPMYMSIRCPGSPATGALFGFPPDGGGATDGHWWSYRINVTNQSPIDPADVASCTWDWDDGTVTNNVACIPGETTSHTYPSNVGDPINRHTYRVILTMRANNGAVATYAANRLIPHWVACNTAVNPACIPD